LLYWCFSPGLKSRGLSRNLAISSLSDADGERLQELGERRVIRDPRGVREQVMDRDLVPGGGGVRDVLLDLVLDVQLALLLGPDQGGEQSISKT